MAQNSNYAIPKLPPLIANGNTTHGYYMCVYKNKWDREMRRSVRVSSTSVGRIQGKDKYGLIEFYPEFIRQYPALRHFQVYRSAGAQRYVFIPKPSRMSARANNKTKSAESSTVAQLSARAAALLERDIEQ